MGRGIIFFIPVLLEDGNGFIDRRELSLMMRFMGENLTETEIQLIIGQIIYYNNINFIIPYQSPVHVYTGFR